MKIQEAQMKTTRRVAVCWGITVLGVSSLALTNALAGEEKSVSPVIAGTTMETSMDLPSSFHRYYGQRVNNWKDSERKIAKVDLDADLNMDGVNSDTDPADGGAFEGTPPGLQVGKGELSKVIIRVTPYRVDFDGEVVVALEVAGINRGDRSGEFASFADEVATTGRIRVWKDATRSQLLLDSANPDKQYVEFTTQYREYPYNLPNAIPRTVYVEGVKPSGPYIGDLRLLLTCSHRKPGSQPQQFVESRKVLLKSFRTTFDHILVTVLPEPLHKEFVNNNAEGVWLKVEGSSK